MTVASAVSELIWLISRDSLCFFNPLRPDLSAEKGGRWVVAGQIDYLDVLRQLVQHMERSLILLAPALVYLYTDKRL